MSEQKEDPYKILGLTPNATDDEIKAAYRKKAIETHPDKHPDDPEKWRPVFQKVQSAYACLKDPNERHIYDISGFWSENPEPDDDDNDIFTEFTSGIHTGFPPGFANIIFMQNPADLSSMFQNILKEKLQPSAINLLHSFLDPLKVEAQDAIHRIQEENQRIADELKYREELKQKNGFKIQALLSELWNIPSAKPRKKKTKVGETRELIPLVLGECELGEKLVHVVPVSSREGCWSWRWSGGPDSYHGFLEAMVYSHEVITDGKQSWEEFTVQTWLTQDQTILFALWKKDDEKPEKLAENLPKYLKKQMLETDEGGLVLVRGLVRMGGEATDWVIGAGWQPNINSLHQGRGWLFQDSGLWIGTKRSNVWIHSPIIDVENWKVKQEIAKEWVFSPYVLDNE